MKDRVREALFNLVGPGIKGTHAVDLFAGTGALGLEAMSRGAREVIFLERHLPTAAILRENIALLRLEASSKVITGNTFLRFADNLPEQDVRWAVFCSPPYDFYVDRTDEMLQLIGDLIDLAPAESIVVVESDARLDPARLPQAGSDDWRHRTYPPAVVSVFVKSP